MPLGAPGPQLPRDLTPNEARDLAVLKAARHRIRHRWRWGKGRIDKPPLLWKHCVLTALRGDYSATIDDRLQAQLPCGFWQLTSYNDHRLTSHADVLALFNRAIAGIEP